MTQSFLNDVNKLPEAEAISILDTYLNSNPSDEEALTLRGRKHWALNHRREAINDFLAALKINPQSKSRIYLDYVNSILDYYNKDLLNP